MHFTIQREVLLKPLQLVAGVEQRRQTLSGTVKCSAGG
jgi:DNA polymerase-3 subunit beta